MPKSDSYDRGEGRSQVKDEARSEYDVLRTEYKGIDSIDTAQKTKI